jgi:general nucleoside transport system permease protein
MRFELVRRSHVSSGARTAASLAALLIALLFGGLVIAAMGRSPVAAFDLYLVQPLIDPWSRRELILKATPLVLIALGLSFCYRANLWNIGAEGQLVFGALCGSWIALSGLAGTPTTLVLMLVAAAIGGAFYALIPAILRVRFGVSEILTSLMLVYVAELLLDYLVRGPWRDPRGFNFPQTRLFEAGYILPTFGEGGRLHIGVIIMIAAVVITTAILARSRFGYRLKVTGDAPRAAAFAGFEARKTTLIVFAISGALAGLAGMVEVAGQIHQLKPSISPGYGFMAITVAFLGRLHPVGILLAGLVLAMTMIGGEAAQVMLKLPLDVTRAFQGVLLFCVLAADALVSYQPRLVMRRVQA